MHDPKQVVFTLDHNVQDFSGLLLCCLLVCMRTSHLIDANMTKYRNIQEFAKEQDVDFYRAGQH